MNREPIFPFEDIHLSGRTVADWRIALNTMLDGQYIGDDPVLENRYGATRDDLSYWGIAFGYAVVDHVGGETFNAQSSMWYGMDLAEYDHGILAGIVVDHWQAIPEPLQQQLGGEEYVRGLAV